MLERKFTDAKMAPGRIRGGWMYGSMRLVLVMLAFASLTGCAAFGDLTGGMFSSGIDEPLDFADDCQQRMIKGSPDEDLSDFKTVTKQVQERTDIYLTAEYRADGKHYTDNFHCVYNGSILSSDDRTAPAAQTAKQ
jgi:hypothetical protein